MGEESISDANNVTAYTLSNTSYTQTDNVNTIFTSEKIDKSDELSDALKYLKIKDAKYYESETATVNDPQGDTTHNPETVTHTSNKNETVTHNRNGNFEQKLLSNRTIPVIVLLMDQMTDQRISPIANFIG